MADAPTDVLEFSLGAERYGVDIGDVSEIVAREELSPVPDSPADVLGEMDLRGQSLRVRDPKAALDVDGDPAGDRVVVMAPAAGEEGPLSGWLVDAVHDVVTVSPEEVDDDAEGPGVVGTLSPDGTDRTLVLVDPGAVFD